MLTLRSALTYITAHPGCTVNDVLEAFGMDLAKAQDDATYFDWEQTGGALLGHLSEEGYVTYVVTSFDGWKYTATGKEWT